VAIVAERSASDITALWLEIEASRASTPRRACCSALSAIEDTDALSARIWLARLPALREDRDAVSADFPRRVLRKRVECARGAVEFGRCRTDRQHDVCDRRLECFGQRQHLRALPRFDFALHTLALRAFVGCAAFGSRCLRECDRQFVSRLDRACREAVAFDSCPVLAEHQIVELDGDVAEYRELQPDGDPVDTDADDVPGAVEHPGGHQRFDQKVMDGDQRGGERDRAPVAQHHQPGERHEEIHVRVHLPRVALQQVQT
jgi:hypothetical protein